MINLLPPKRVLDIKIARTNTILSRYIKLLLLSILVLTAAVIAAHYFFIIQESNTQHTLAINQKKVQQLEPVQKQAEDLSQTVNTISGLLSRNIKFSDMLTQIGSIMPPGSVLTGLQFSIEDVESPLVVSAQVDNAQKAAVLRNNLASSPLFKKAEIKNITQIEKKSDTNPPSVSTEPVLPTTDTSTRDSYTYTTVINAYFKDNVIGVKK